MDLDTRICEDGADWDFWHLYDTDQWEAHTHAILRRYLTPGSTFIDIGAWIGPVSLWALELGAKVYAYEPDSEAFRQLAHNCMGTGLHAFRMAVAPTTGTGYLAEEGTFGNSLSRLHPNKGLKVGTIAPVDLLAGRDPALIKIDIEGGEIDILQDFLTLVRCPILVAWHSPWWQHPFDPDFTGWTVEGNVTGFAQSLLVPNA